MEIFAVIIKMLWLMLPAYLSNPAAAISVAKTGTGKPIDFGKFYKNKRILGDGKTYKGLFSGIFFGIFIAILQNFINKLFLNESMPQFNYASIITLPVGAMLGDLTASFFKRRLGLTRGQSFPLVDQLDFVAGAWIFTIIFSNAWFQKNFSLEIILTAIILTPILHLIVNIIGYKIGISKEPW
ncbi:MAG: CDP-2,3-bis-(O-geranylgeranyl)-sn-glycerol synthase [bacterium]